MIDSEYQPELNDNTPTFPWPPGEDDNEVAYGDLLFDYVDWSSAIALHVMVKVAPVSARFDGVVVTGTLVREPEEVPVETTPNMSPS